MQVNPTKNTLYQRLLEKGSKPISDGSISRKWFSKDKSLTIFQKVQPNGNYKMHCYIDGQFIKKVVEKIFSARSTDNWAIRITNRTGASTNIKEKGNVSLFFNKYI